MVLGPVAWSSLLGNTQSDLFPQSPGELSWGRVSWGTSRVSWGMRGLRGEGLQETEEQLVAQAGGFLARLPPRQLSFTPSLKVAPGHSGLPESLCVRQAPGSAAFLSWLVGGPTSCRLWSSPLPLLSSWKGTIQRPGLGGEEEIRPCC